LATLRVIRAGGEGHCKSQATPDLLESKKGEEMKAKYMTGILLITILISGNIHARLYVENDFCNSTMGKVLNVVNNEFFTIKICDEAKTFEEFSYCYGVKDGDTVIFETYRDNCDVVSFSVLGNGTQCGVRCT
jgi:hypothetical protein